MAQQIRATFNLNYGSEAQRFTPSGTSPQFSAGVSASGGFSFSAAGASSVLSRVLLPLNADYDTGSGIGNEGFRFTGFPNLESVNNTDSVPVLDVNGLPLDFTRLSVLCVRVRAVDPDQPWGGTVNITTANDVVPGNTFGREGIASECLLLYQETDGWEPGATGQLQVEFVPTTAPTAALVNAMVELLVIGMPVPSEVPEITTAPTISGTVHEGDTLTATSGTVTGTPTPLTGYQWVRCPVGGGTAPSPGAALPNPGTDIPGATGAAYILQAADVGYSLRVRQRASNSAGTYYRYSSFTAPIVP